MSDALKLWDDVAAVSRRLRLAVVPFVASRYTAFFEISQQVPPEDLTAPAEWAGEWVLLVTDAAGSYFYGPASFNRVLTSFLLDAKDYLPLPARITHSKPVPAANHVPTPNKRTWSLF